MKKLSFLILFIATAVFADAVIFSGNDVKALKQNLDLFGITKILSINGDPSTGAGVNAPKGSIALSANQGKLFQKFGVPDTNWKKVLSGQADLATEVTGILPIANGGTGSATQNFVDLSSGQTIAGTKTFSSTIVGNISGNASTVTTNANLSGDVTSVGNTTTYSGIVPIAKGGTGSATQNFVDLTTAQTVGGTKTFSSTIQGSISGNSATVTTNANLSGDITSVGNTTTYNGIVPVNKGGTGSATRNFVDLTSSETIAGTKTFSSTISGSINGNAATVTTIPTLSNEVSNTGNSVTLSNSAVIAKVLTGFTAGSGTITATDTILQGIQKNAGNDALKQPLATLTTKGDTYVATAASTVVRQAVGSDHQFLVADSGTSTGLRWTYEYERNYIANPGAETDTTGWSTYADAAQTNPVDMTGGSPVSTFTRSTSSPLNNVGSFVFSKGAANRQGEGFSYDFSIDPADTGKILRIDFNYKISSGTYADDDMSCWIYDVTNATLIQPTPYKIKNTTINDYFSEEFQTSSSTSYRFGCHVDSTSALAYDLKFDKFKIYRGPKIYSTAETGYSAEISSTGVVSNESKDWINGNCVMSGTNSATGTCTLNTGIITTSMNCVAQSLESVGATRWVNIRTSSTGFVWDASNTSVLVATGIQVFCQKAGVDYTNATSGRLSSSEADTRVISAIVGGTCTASANGVLVFPSVLKDTHSAYSTSTGKFTAPVAGFYQITYGGDTALAQGNSIYASIDGNTTAGLSRPTIAAAQTANQILAGAGTVYANAGSTIDLKATATATPASGTVVSITRVSGPSQIAASESVSASYWLSANFTASTTIPINFDQKEWDSHNAVTTSATAWKFTAPISGLYQIGGHIESASSFYVHAYKGGTILKPIGWQATGAHGTVIGTVRLLAGEYIDVRPTSSITIVGGVLSGNSTSQIVITRVGNY